MKMCKKCGIIRMYDQFSKDKYKPDGFSSVCKPCRKIYMIKYYSSNAEVAKERSRTWFQNNKSKGLARTKEWCLKNRNRHLENRKSYHSYKMKNDIDYRLNYSLRAHVRKAYKIISQEKNGSTLDILGYDPDKLKLRLEVNFLKGMSWSNYGEWEIDHRIPVSKMIEKGERRISVINSLANLKPMWKTENRSKGNRRSY